MHQGEDNEHRELQLIPGTSSDRILLRPTNDILFEIPSDLYPPFYHSKGNAGIGATIGAGCTILRGDPIRFPEQWKTNPTQIAILGNAFELRRDARHWARSIVALREAVGNRTLIYAPGAMDVSNLALLTYMGVDLFDDSLVLPVTRKQLLALRNAAEFIIQLDDKKKAKQKEKEAEAQESEENSLSSSSASMT